MSMMARVSALLMTVTDFYKDLNPSTLSGAIDILVVKHPNGELVGSPFHVRFGKLQLLRAQEKLVEVRVNDELVNLKMKVGEAGEAFFVVESNQPVPEELATSPISQASKPAVDQVVEPLDLNLPTSSHSSSFLPISLNLSPTTQSEPQQISSQPISLSPESSPNLKTPPTPLSATPNSSFTPDLPLPSTHLQQSPSSPALKINTLSPTPCEISKSSSSPILTINPSVPSDAEPLKDSLPIPNLLALPPLSEGITESSPTLPFTSETSTKKMNGETSMNLLIEQSSGEQKIVESSELSAVDLKPYHARDVSNISTLSNEIVETSLSTSSEILPNGNETSSPKLLSSILPHFSNPDNAIPRSKSLYSSPNNHFKEEPEIKEDVNHPLSDSEVEHRIDTTRNRGSIEMNPLEFHESSPPRSQSIWSWGWGKMPVKGMTEASTITSTPSSTENFITQPDDGRNLSIETTNPIQTNEMNFHDDEHPIQLSLCGYKQYITSSDFYSKLITFEQLCQNPNVLNSHELVLRMNRKFYPSNVVGPIFASLILFQRPLPSSTLDQILLEHKEKRSSWRNWWNRSSVDEHSSTSKPPIVTLTSPRTSEPTKLMLSNEMAPSPNTSIFSTSPTPLAPMTMNEKWLTSSPSTYSESTNSNPLPDSKQLSRDNLLPSSSPPDMFLLPQGSQSAAELSPTTKSSLGYTSTSFSPTFSLAAPLPTSKYYHKSLRLTSDELKSLGLKKGCNLVTYTVHTPFQGIARCRSRIFLWDSDERVVISDIDGTITKSDALGHFFTMLGRDWTHSGVASLYTSIRNNGYQLLYLTSRAIGQAQFTRNYLNKVEQGQYQLPDGPVFLSPDRLLAAFTREVIQRRPEEFKIACLRDIRSLFHTEINPFHAGFGNRSTDAFSYRAVGVPANRIFHINANGEVRRELLEGYRATYFQLNDLVDQIFPPLNIVLDQEFNDWKFWKTEIPPLDIQEEEDEDEEEEEEEDEEEEEEGDEYDDENSLSNDGIEEKKSSMDSPSQSKNDVKAAHKLSNDTELDRVSEFIAYPYL